MKTTFLHRVLVVVLLASVSACATHHLGLSFKTLNGQKPLVIAHRGSPGTLPEHTLEGYKLAIEQGADFIEPDLVLTKDGVLIARHEPWIEATTDVAAKFPASRKVTKMVDGRTVTDFFASDFTLARNQSMNGQYSIPTLDEIIALAKSESNRLGRTIGIYPEIKHSIFHSSGVGFGINTFEDKLLATLHSAYGNSKAAPVFIQSFEVANLQYLRTKTNIKLAQLVGASGVNDDGTVTLVAPF
jgi:glycerophosphoryl diester phosphodiesterase